MPNPKNSALTTIKMLTLLNILLASLTALSLRGSAWVSLTNHPVNAVTTTVIAAVTAAVTTMVMTWLLSIAIESGK